MGNFIGGFIIGLLAVTIVDLQDRITEMEVSHKLLMNSVYGKPTHSDVAEAVIYHYHVTHDHQDDNDHRSSPGILDVLRSGEASHA